jgi:hypothetical protein
VKLTPCGQDKQVKFEMILGLGGVAGVIGTATLRGIPPLPRTSKFQMKF